VVQRVTGNLIGELVLRCFDEVNQGSGRVDGRLFVGCGSESGSERGSELRLEFLVDLNCNRGIYRQSSWRDGIGSGNRIETDSEIPVKVFLIHLFVSLILIRFVSQARKVSCSCPLI
jgi:hypothetical protein